MITGHFHHFNVIITTDGEVEAAMAEAVDVVVGGVHAHLEEPVGQPLPELVLDDRSPTTLTVWELEHELITGTVVGAPERHDTVEGGHWAVDGPGAGGEGDLVDSLLELDGLLEDDSGNSSLSGDSSDSAPGELSHGITLGWGGRNESGRADHAEEKDDAERF